MFQKQKIGMTSFLNLQTEWTTARTFVHFLSQATRFLQTDTDDDKIINHHRVRALHKVNAVMDMVLEADKVFHDNMLAMGDRKSKNSPPFDPVKFNTMFEQKLEQYEADLPFEILVQDPSTSNRSGRAGASGTVDGSNNTYVFPVGFLKTMGNFFHPRLILYIHWKPIVISSDDNTTDINTKKKYCLYATPRLSYHSQSHKKYGHLFMKQAAANSKGGSGDNKKDCVKMSACLDEFCKEQVLSNWNCPKCGEKAKSEGEEGIARKGSEAKLTLSVWKLPDLLTFHIKRFHIANNGGWREKIVSKVDFPLNGLDMSPWIHKSSPENCCNANASNGNGVSALYDLVGVVNHIGGLTGGHYVATCRATPCTENGYEEIAHSYTGGGGAGGAGNFGLNLANDLANSSDKSNSVSSVNSSERSIGNNPSSNKGASLLSRTRSSAATISNARGNSASKTVLKHEISPLWLQFDDDLVESMPEREVCTEAAYVLFYRRRRITPSNYAKYSVFSEE